MEKNNWIEKLMGFSEDKWDFKLSSISPKLIKDMGTFKELSITDLNEQILCIKKNDKIPLLNVITRTNLKYDEKFDTSALQFRGIDKAMYQVASNFNCMELSSEHQSPFSGYYLTNLMSDCTQGPSASAGAGGGAILRVAHHFEKPINLLRDTILKPKNGKLLYSQAYKLADMVDSSEIRIGLHSKVRANFERSRYIFNYNPKGPVIDQVYTSTCKCVSSNPNVLSAKLLKAAYDGTYMAAAIKKTPELVLTLIGGMSFRNNEKQIAEAIANAHNKYAQYLQHDCEIILPIYDKYYKNILKTLQENTIINHIQY